MAERWHPCIVCRAVMCLIATVQVVIKITGLGA
jgi:hypothetical protein